MKNNPYIIILILLFAISCRTGSDSCLFEYKGNVYAMYKRPVYVFKHDSIKKSIADYIKKPPTNTELYIIECLDTVLSSTDSIYNQRAHKRQMLLGTYSPHCHGKEDEIFTDLKGFAYVDGHLVFIMDSVNADSYFRKTYKRKTVCYLTGPDIYLLCEDYSILDITDIEKPELFTPRSEDAGYGTSWAYL